MRIPLFDYKKVRRRRIALRAFLVALLILPLGIMALIFVHHQMQVLEARQALASFLSPAMGGVFPLNKYARINCINGEWIVFYYIDSSHTSDDFTLAIDSRGRQYYTRYHFCGGLEIGGTYPDAASFFRSTREYEWKRQWLF